MNGTFRRSHLSVAIGIMLDQIETGAHAFVEDGQDPFRVGLRAYSNVAAVARAEGSAEGYRAVKVRFGEGRNSKEVLDFSLFLSPAEVWNSSNAVILAAGAFSGSHLSEDAVQSDWVLTSPIAIGVVDLSDAAHLKVEARARELAQLERICQNPGPKVILIERSREGYFQQMDEVIQAVTVLIDDEASVLPFVQQLGEALSVHYVDDPVRTPWKPKTKRNTNFNQSGFKFRRK